MYGGNLELVSRRENVQVLVGSFCGEFKRNSHHPTTNLCLVEILLQREKIHLGRFKIADKKLLFLLSGECTKGILRRARRRRAEDVEVSIQQTLTITLEILKS